MAKTFSNSSLALLSPRASSMLENSNRQKPLNKVSKAILQMRCKTADKRIWSSAARAAVRSGAVAADKRGTLAPWVVHVLNEAVKAATSKRTRSA